MPERGRYRKRISSAQGVEVICDGKKLINFCSNDYLGLANDPEIKSSFIKAAEKYGVGSGASQYICGYSDAHHDLEQAVMDVTGYKQALCFSSGYMANLAIQSAFVHRGDQVFIDRLAHASIYDAAILSRASFHRYQHRDVVMLEQQLERHHGKLRMIVTDGVFSMDGDIAPLAELSALSTRFKTLLVVDDAHGFAVTGKGGMGSVDACEVNQEKIGLYMATFGKACGVYGAFVAGPENLIDHMAQSSRTLIYTTALPPAVVAAAATGMHKAMQENWRRERLQTLITRFRSGSRQLSMPLLNSITPIQPFMVYTDETAMVANKMLLDAGFLISAIRPPTVPEGKARLRITITASHTEDQIDQLLDALHKLCKQLQA